jgi:hypothetical protein
VDPVEEPVPAKSMEVDYTDAGEAFLLAVSI